MSPQLWGIAWTGHFLAGVCDAIAGGGGMIGLPALLWAGLPPHVALGTNKLSSTVGTMVSTWRLRRAAPLQPGVLWIGIPLALSGSWLGAHVVLGLETGAVHALIGGGLPLVLVMMWASRLALFSQKAPPSTPSKTSPHLLHTAGISSVAGCYDGAIGPGVGTLLMLGLHRWVGLSWLQASFHTKCINLSTNAMALCVMVSAGKVMWGLGIGCAVANACGAVVGTLMALRYGDTLIRRVVPWVMAGILLTLMMRIAWFP